MRKHGQAVFVVGLLLISARPADAQVLGNFFHGLGRDFVRNNAWPEPFVQPDRESVNLVMEIMVAKGWQRQNLLCGSHFNDDNTKLNHAGEEQVRWILTSVPPQHRTLFVERGMTSAITESRVKAIQQTAGGVLPQGQYAEIVETNMNSDGFPADVVNAIQIKALESIPRPKLPKADSGDSNGAGGGGAAGN